MTRSDFVRISHFVDAFCPVLYIKVQFTPNAPSCYKRQPSQLSSA